MLEKHALLEPESFYHLYNRANGSEVLFLNDENYRYFLQQYNKYIEPIAETYCYCLMPNHFHFLVLVKPYDELKKYFNQKKGSSSTLQGFKTLEGFAKEEKLSTLLSQQFSHLFNSYTQAFNKANNRRGSLFMHPFKRKHIRTSSYLTTLIHYIHFNPVSAGLANTCDAWKFSSYNAIVSNKNSLIKKDDVIELFDDLDNFKFVHRQISSYEFLD